MHATVAEDMLLHVAKAWLPSPLGRTGLVVTPAPKEGQTEGNKPKTEESHPGWRRRAEAPQGNGVHLMNASGLENGNGRGEAKGSDEGHGGTVRRTGKEQSCSLGQIFCCFIKFSVNQLVFARTGYAGEC